MKDTKIIRTYIIGFILSLLLTAGAYTLVTLQLSHAIVSSYILIGALLLAALVQLFVQLLFFLHLGEGDRPKWNMVFFVITFSSIVVVIIASIWIMNHLNYNMTLRQMDQYIDDQSSF